MSTDREKQTGANTAGQSALIETLEAEEQTLLLKLSECRKNITTAKLYWIKSTYGVAVGSVVQDSKGNIYKVTSVDTRLWKDRPWLQGHLKKKDGTFGTGLRNIYSDWTLLSL